MRMGEFSWLTGGVPPVTHTHALFAEQSQSIPNNLVALFGPQPSIELLGPKRAICGRLFAAQRVLDRKGVLRSRYCCHCFGFLQESRRWLGWVIWFRPLAV